MLFIGLQNATSRSDLTLSRRGRRLNCSESSTLQHVVTAIRRDDMATKLVFSPLENKLLVHEVQNNLVLYNIADENYKNNIIKDDTWKHISNTIGKSGKYLNMKQ